jgi:putative flippase GtrA
MTARTIATLSASDERLRGTLRQIISFGAIGIVSTLAYVLIYALLRGAMPAAAANAVALLVTAVGNTAANRRLTFEVQGRDGLARDHAAGLVALGIALAITTAAVAAMDILMPHRGRIAEIGVLVAANGLSTVIRFAFLRTAIDHRPSPARTRTSSLATAERTRQ